MEWEELKDNLNEVKKKVEEDLKSERLAGEEHDILVRMADRIIGIFSELEGLEKEIKVEGFTSSDPLIKDKFKTIFNRFQAIPTVVPWSAERFAERAKSHLNEIWGVGISGVTSLLEREGKEFGVENWSVGVTTGFPAGVSGTITIHFRLS